MSDQKAFADHVVDVVSSIEPTRDQIEIICGIHGITLRDEPFHFDRGQVIVMVDAPDHMGCFDLMNVLEDVRRATGIKRLDFCDPDMWHGYPKGDEEAKNQRSRFESRHKLKT